METELLTVQEVAERLGITDVSVRSAISRGTLRHVVKYGKKLIPAAEADAYKQRTQPEGQKKAGRPIVRSRYIFNTSGYYCAFIKNGFLYAPNGKWLGTVTKAGNVYHPDGKHMGQLTDDGRIIVNPAIWNSDIGSTVHSSYTSPARPPLKRERVQPPPKGYRDIFEDD